MTLKTWKKMIVALMLLQASAGARAALVDLGNGLINHPDANMTWVADGNLFATMAAADPDLVAKVVAAWAGGPIDSGTGWFHTPAAGDFNTTTGYMTWFGAQAWINYLNLTNYKGYTDWRSPDIGLGGGAIGQCGPGGCLPYEPDFPISSSEWWQLFFNELGGVARVPISDTHNSNYFLFTNIIGGWGTRHLGTNVVIFGSDGQQSRAYVLSYLPIWPVRTGLSVANPPPAPHLGFVPSNLLFGSQAEGTTSAARTVTITNTGTAEATITGITASAEFGVTHNCAATLAVNASCTASVTFTPAALASRTGTLSVAGNAAASMPLSGVGGIFASLSTSATTVTVGVPVTLTWSASAQQTACEGVGGVPGDGWAGPLVSSGTRQVVSGGPGNIVYGLRCTHAAQSLPAGEATVSVAHTMPTVTLGSSSTNVTVNDAFTLTWTSANASACTAGSNGSSAVWTGSMPTSGSAVVNENTTGLITYNITCTAAGQRAESSIQVMNNARPNSGGGGGGGGGGRLDLGLLGLLALALGLQARHRMR